MQRSQIKQKAEEQEKKDPSTLNFTKDFFMYQIDKFFSKELSVVLRANDDEYDKYLAKQAKEDEDFQRQINDLDDYFLNDQKPAVPSKVFFIYHLRLIYRFQKNNLHINNNNRKPMKVLLRNNYRNQLMSLKTL